MVYTDRVESQWPLRLLFPVGIRVPLYCTASGKLYLSALPKAQRQAVISQLQLSARAVNTITDKDRLMQELENIHNQDVSVDREEYIDGVIAVAVPVGGNKRTLFSTVSFQAPVARMVPEDTLGHVE